MVLRAREGRSRRLAEVKRAEAKAATKASRAAEKAEPEGGASEDQRLSKEVEAARRAVAQAKLKLARKIMEEEEVRIIAEEKCVKFAKAAVAAAAAIAAEDARKKAKNCNVRGVGTFFRYMFKFRPSYPIFLKIHF